MAKLRFCELCGEPIEGHAPNAKRCKACREARRMQMARQKGAKHEYANHDNSIRNRRIREVYPKLDRIVGDGYAERQMAATLAQAEKIDVSVFEGRRAGGKNFRRTTL